MTRIAIRCQPRPLAVFVAGRTFLLLVRPGQCEVCRIMIERRRFPGTRGVACCARRRKFACVQRICRLGEILLVAGIAILRQSGVLSVHVAAETVLERMTSRERKSGQSMIDLRRLPRGRRVTIGAGCRVIPGGVVWCAGIIVIGAVAIDTAHRRPFERALVAIGTGDRAMRSVEREMCVVVARGTPCIPFDIMAFLTCQSESQCGMSRILCHVVLPSVTCGALDGYGDVFVFLLVGMTTLAGQLSMRSKQRKPRRLVHRDKRHRLPPSFGAVASLAACSEFGAMDVCMTADAIGPKGFHPCSLMTPCAGDVFMKAGKSEVRPGMIKRIDILDC